MNNKNQIKAIVLDLDRTLVDLKVNWALVRNEMANFCAKNGIKVSFAYPKPIYKVARAVSKIFSKGNKDTDKTKKLYADFIAIIKKEELKSTEKAELMPGAKDFLEFLHINNIPFAVLSNNNSRCIANVFKRFKLPNPKIIIGSDNVKYLKPHPEGLNKILKRMKIKNTQCLLIGDSAAELRLGKITGVKTFIVNAYYKNFKQLKDILR